MLAGHEHIIPDSELARVKACFVDPWASPAG